MEPFVPPRVEAEDLPYHVEGRQCANHQNVNGTRLILWPDYEPVGCVSTPANLDSANVPLRFEGVHSAGVVLAGGFGICGLGTGSLDVDPQGIRFSVGVTHRPTVLPAQRVSHNAGDRRGLDLIPFKVY